MSSRDPEWNTPARLDGLPVRHWKRRTGSSENGTMAEMVKRWLGLAWTQQQDCSLGWGPNKDGHSGAMGASEITSYVRRHGLPPAMLVARDKPPTHAEIEAMFAKPGCRESPPSNTRHSI